MPFFSKSGDQWVVLGDDKAVLYSDPDRARALEFFKGIATKPRGTCPHPKVEAHIALNGQLPTVEMVQIKMWPGGGEYGWRIIDNGGFDWLYKWICVTCGKTVAGIVDTKKEVVDSPSEAV